MFYGNFFQTNHLLRNYNILEYSYYVRIKFKLRLSKLTLATETVSVVTLNARAIERTRNIKTICFYMTRIPPSIWITKEYI